MGLSMSRQLYTLLHSFSSCSEPFVAVCLSADYFRRISTRIYYGPRGARLWARGVAPQPCIRLDTQYPDHEAVIHFGGKAPRRRSPFS